MMLLLLLLCSSLGESFNVVYFVDYKDLRDPIYTCPNCGAKFWFSERMKQTQRTANPIFSLCCSKGNVKLPLLTVPPETLLRLYFDIELAELRDFLGHY